MTAHTTVFILLLIALAAVLVTLIVGITAMIRGGEFNKKYGNKLMRLRIILQGVALVLFAVALMMGQK